MSRSLRLIACLLIVTMAGCASPSERRALSNVHLERVELRDARESLKQGRRKTLTVEARAGHLLDAAARAAGTWDMKLGERDEKAARIIYNHATGELTELMRNHPRFWKREQAIASQETGGTVYQISIAGPTKTLWDPAYFSDYEQAHRISHRGFRQQVKIRGVGAALVGERDPKAHGKPPEPFAEHGELVAAVTATLDFSKASDGVRKVTLALHNPLKVEKTRLMGKERTLAADFTAPLALAPRRSEFWMGLQAMIDVERFVQSSGLHRYEPYDRERIPVIFIHGLMSTPQMWLNVINDLNSDPELRKRYQPWVFRYPSGLPVIYTALELREQLREAQQTFPMPNGYVLVGHSMGGLISRLQSSEVGRKIWDGALGHRADHLYDKVDATSKLKRATIFEPDPNAKRLIFICVPHRGSDIASGSIGAFATSLIRMPSTLVRSMENTVGSSLEMLTGVRGARFPTSIQSLSPKSPTLIAMNEIPPVAPHHSIIGDRGRGDSPNSSDGVVPYWSSHLNTAGSELIVPGPHGSYNLPQTIGELRRILRQQVGLPKEKN